MWSFLQNLDVLSAFSHINQSWYFALYGSLVCKSILSIYCWRAFRLNNGYVFRDTEPQIINIVYGSSEISGQFESCSITFSFVI